jgi:hypothetical protein
MIIFLYIVGSSSYELSTIAKIHKYKGLHEKHNFILMAMEVHGTPRCDMDPFVRECVCLFHGRRFGSHLSFFFTFNFSNNVSISLQHALTFPIMRM